MYAVENALGRGRRKKDTTRLDEGLQAQKLNDDGLPIKKRTIRPRVSVPRSSENQSLMVLESSDSDDDDYKDTVGDTDSSSAEDTDDEDGANMVIGNAEVRRALRPIYYSSHIDPDCVCASLKDNSAHRSWQNKASSY